MKYIEIVILIIVFGCSRNTEKSDKDLISELKHEANSNYEKNNYEMAIKQYTSLIHFDSLQGEYFYRRGYCLSQTGDNIKAVKDYEKSIQLNYRESDSYYNIGVIYLLINDSIAKSYFEKSLEIDPSSIRSKKFLESLEKNNELHGDNL